MGARDEAVDPYLATTIWIGNLKAGDRFQHMIGIGDQFGQTLRHFGGGESVRLWCRSGD